MKPTFLFSRRVLRVGTATICRARTPPHPRPPWACSLCSGEPSAGTPTVQLWYMEIRQCSSVQSCPGAAAQGDLGGPITSSEAVQLEGTQKSQETNSSKVFQCDHVQLCPPDHLLESFSPEPKSFIVGRGIYVDSWLMDPSQDFILCFPPVHLLRYPISFL